MITLNFLIKWTKLDPFPITSFTEVAYHFLHDMTDSIIQEQLKQSIIPILFWAKL